MRFQINVTSEKAQIFFFSSFIVVGVAIFIVMAIIFIGDADFRKSAIKTTAYITNIESYSSGNDKSYHVYVGYEVDGEQYERRISSWHSGMQVGNPVTIYFNPDNPGQISDSGPATTLILLFPIALSLFGVIPLVSMFKKKAKLDYLQTNGTILKATVVAVEPGNTFINDRQGMILICASLDNSPNRRTFRSDQLWCDSRTLEKAIGKEIDVYVENGNYENYAIDAKDFLNSVALTDALNSYN